MDPMRCEIDDLTLMDAKDCVRATRHEQGQVRERTEAAVTKEYVASAEAGMDLCHARHVVSAQRCRHNLGEHSGANMKHRQKVSNGETAAGPLASGMAEVFLKLRNIGHRETGSIRNEYAVPMPSSGVVHLGFWP
jgi:hypothetical protein